MRDYAAGAFEALSWVKMLIQGSKERCILLPSYFDSPTGWAT